MNGRRTRIWWVSIEGRISQRTGFDCGAHYKPSVWFFPCLASSLSEGHHLFDTKKEAAMKAFAYINAEHLTLHDRMDALLKDNDL
jgi:hypothetical protein